MKKLLITLSLLAAPLALPSTIAETTMQAPFAFKAGNIQLPAGDYRVRTELSPSGVYRLFFQNSAGQHVVVPMVRIHNTMPTPTRTGFVFRCQTGDNCQLREVHSGGGPAFQLNP
ncbi:MAG: hypothetical protein U0R19_23935 [Bryobacteraceae bacterium]